MHRGYFSDNDECNMKPIGKYIVIKAIEEEITSASGLLLSADDVSAMRYKKGVVVAPGTNVEVIDEDDQIYYDKNAGFTMMINSESYTVIQERDVVVVI